MEAKSGARRASVCSEPLLHLERKANRSASVFVVCQPKPAAMRVNNRTANRQTQPKPLRFGGPKRLERTLQHLWRKTRPVVLYHHAHLAVHLFGLKRHGLTRARPAFHCVATVHD